MTDDAVLYKTTPGKTRVPLYTGKLIHQFNHRFGEPCFWLEPTEARAALLPARQKAIQRLAAEHGLECWVKPEELKLDYQSHRLAFRDVARNTDERTMIATILPRGVFCPHTMSLEVVFHDEMTDGKLHLNVPGLNSSERFYLLAVFNSFVADYQLRQKVTAHLSFFFIYNLPVPRLTLADEAFGPIVQRAAQLIYTTHEFDGLAKKVTAALKLPPAAVKGVTETAARARLRAELDGLVANLYGLTESEFTHILSTFPLVPQGVKDAALAGFRAAGKGELQ